MYARHSNYNYLACKTGDCPIESLSSGQTAIKPASCRGVVWTQQEWLQTCVCAQSNMASLLQLLQGLPGQSMLKIYLLAGFKNWDTNQVVSLPVPKKFPFQSKPSRSGGCFLSPFRKTLLRSHVRSTSLSFTLSTTDQALDRPLPVQSGCPALT